MPREMVKREIWQNPGPTSNKHTLRLFRIPGHGVDEQGNRDIRSRGSKEDTEDTGGAEETQGLLDV